VYPHPAIIELLGLGERLKYKASKLQKYWPELDRDQRHIAVVKNLNYLRAALNERISGVVQWLPMAQSFEQASQLKGYEDTLDAVVCAWIGYEFLAGRCVAYGDKESAIWLPKPSFQNQWRHNL
jgi:predicted RNase H-like nuclease